jgi:hypothetical protein
VVLVRLRGGGDCGVGEEGKDESVAAAFAKGAMFSLFQSPSREVRARFVIGDGSGVGGGWWSLGSDSCARLPRTELRVERRVCMAGGGGGDGQSIRSSVMMIL